MTQIGTILVDRPKLVLSAISFLLAALMIVNCGGSSSETSGAPGEPGTIQTVVVERQVEVEVERVVEVEKEVLVQGETVIQTVVVEKMVEVSGETVVQTVVVEREVEVAKEVAKVVERDVSSAVPGSDQTVEVSFQPQERIIVRNADMSVQSDDPGATVDAIADLASARGGWVVNSVAQDRGSYNITIRVPAELLDAVIDEISRSVAKVESIQSDSSDFTEEFIDLSARQTTIQETVDALTELLRNANYDEVEELLEVQREITRWQTELESIDGRLRFIRQSADFSRLHVTVNLSPIPMRVEAGADVSVGLQTQRQYTARFFPPAGYDRYEISWDFGDGTPPRPAISALRTRNEDGLLSVPVVHSYNSDGFSPFVVTVNIKAFSENGLAEGEDKLWVHVFPVMFDVDAGGDIDVGVHERRQYSASFDPPDGYDDFEITWDFGDATGTEVVRSALRTRDEEGYLSVPVVHTYDNDEFSPHVVSVKVKASSAHGIAEGSDKFWASVKPISVDVDAGDDIGVGTNVQRQYTARFVPPDGYDRFEIIWNFGDGTGPKSVYSALRTQDDASYLSAPVVHTYTDDAFSPYVVTIDVKASSDRGVAAGGDQLWAEVSELPKIEAFVSVSDWQVEENRPVTFNATFNHPETLRDLTYLWDFRDGSKIVEGKVETEDTRVEIDHAFERYRPDYYPVKFEIWGESDAGEVRETYYLEILVDPAPEVNSADFEPGETATQGLNVLVAFFTFAGTAAIWLATTSPIWLIAGAVIFFVARFAIRRRSNLRKTLFVPDAKADEPHDTAETSS